MAITGEMFLREKTFGWEEPSSGEYELSETSKAISRHLNEMTEARFRREARALVEQAARQGRQLTEPQALLEWLEAHPNEYADYDRRFKEGFRR